jgi:hypothetical protein
LISASTCPAAALSAAEVALGEAVLAEAVGCTVAVPVAVRVGCADGEVPGADPDAGADGLDLAGCVRLAALLDGIVTTTGDAAMAISDWLPQEAASAALQLAEAADEPAARPVVDPVENAPWVR